jgi:hypothetical protein
VVKAMKLACAALVCAALAGCALSPRRATPPVRSGAAAGENPSPYLYIWAGDEDGQDSDFMAVVDVLPGSPRYGQVIASVPVGVKGTMPHHLEYELPAPGRWLFGNGHHTEQIFLFDLAEPELPRVHRVLGPVPPFRYPHDFARLPNGNVLVGFLRSEGPSPLAGDPLMPGGHGGIAELDPEGRVLRSSSAAVAGFEDPIRPYGLAVLPAIDRLLTTSARMHEGFSADVVQVWRLSDLELLTTLKVPPALLPNGELLRTRDPDGETRPTGHRMPFVPRVMADGSVLLNSYGCGIYRVTSLAGDAPAIANVYTIAVPPEGRIGGCSIPVVIGRFWLMPAANAHKVVVLDISDPAHPFQVASLASDQDFFPHWLAKDPGADRLIVGEEMGEEHRMLMLRVDPATGRIWWDESIRSADGSLGISFRRKDWPHGATGDALGHAALFRP